MPPTDSEKDRRNNWKIGALSALAALVAGAIGAGSSLWTAHVQSAGSASEDKASFVRQQKQAAYSKFLADAYEEKVVVEGMYNASYAKVVAFPPLTDFKKSEDQLTLDFYSIEITGSQPAIEQAQQLHYLVEKIFVVGVGSKECVGIYDLTHPVEAETKASYAQSVAVEKFLNAANNFALAVRPELT